MRNVASWIGDQYSQSGSPVDPPWCLPSFRRQATRHSGYACPNRAAHVRLHGAPPWLPADDPPLSGSVAWLRRPQREIVGPHRAPAPLLGGSCSTPASTMEPCRRSRRKNSSTYSATPTARTPSLRLDFPQILPAQIRKTGTVCSFGKFYVVMTPVPFH